MDHLILSFFAVLSLVLTAFGVYLTIKSREDTKTHNVPKWVEDHVKTYKWLGPVFIGVGVLGLVGSGWGLFNGMHYPDHSPGKANFGFKFY